MCEQERREVVQSKGVLETICSHMLAVPVAADVVHEHVDPRLPPEHLTGQPPDRSELSCRSWAQLPLPLRFCPLLWSSTLTGIFPPEIVSTRGLVVMAGSVAYPVHVNAVLDPGTSRWLWLLKWILAIPHYFVLFFLWIGFLVASVIAFFAILFTEHYPRALFDYNVGVMRWSWRVNYYAYGALATDQYPPFTLAEVPTYPAQLAVDYPEHLSRGLVLVKWWLLAIPHYLIVGVFVGGGAWAANRSDDWQWNLGGGLVSVLVLFAAIALLFTGTYPKSLFDLILGLNRWALRVSGYAGLMTDAYPPFRLDLGGTDPEDEVPAAEVPPSDDA
jgi:hypothetical protein